MKHVLQIVGDPVGGVRRHVHDILSSSSPEVEYSYCYGSIKSDACFDRQIVKIQSRIRKVVSLKIFKRPSLWDLWNIVVLFVFVIRNDVSVVHGHGAKAGAYARFLSILPGVRSVYTPHGGSLHDTYGYVGGAFYASVEKALFFLTDFFVFESNYSKRQYFGKVKSNFTNYIVNNNGVFQEEIIKSSGEGGCSQMLAGYKYNLGVFASLRLEKGHEFAIKAVRQLVDSGLDVCLHCFGGGDGLDMLSHLVIENGVDGRVVFYGDTVNVYPCMKRMDAVLIPSIFESSPYVSLEALALHVPVVAFDVGGLSDNVKDGVTGYLVDFGNVSQFSARVGSVLAGELDIPEFFPAEFDAANMVRNLISVYCRV